MPNFHRLDGLVLDVQRKVTAGLVTSIGNNIAAITDYSEHWGHGEIISPAFAESTVDLLVSGRFAKKQQMQWSKKGAHRLLQHPIDVEVLLADVALERELPRSSVSRFSRV